MRWFAFFALVVSANSWADTELFYHASEASEVRQVNIRVADGLVRTDYNQKGYTIWNSNTKVFTHVKHKSREYLAVDEETLTGMAQLGTGLMALLGDQAALAADASAQANIPKEVTKTNRKDGAAGIVCDIVQVKESGKPIAEICMADAMQLAIAPSEMGTLQSLADFAAMLADSFLSTQGTSLPGWLKAFISDQVPLKYWTIQDGKPFLEMELQSVAHPQMNAQVFQAPVGYTATDFSKPLMQ